MEYKKMKNAEKGQISQDFVLKLEKTDIKNEITPDLLKSLFETQYECLKIFKAQYECLKIFKHVIRDHNQKDFKFLENLLISDEDPYIREIAAEILVHKFPRESKDSLIWVIEYEKSPIVLKTLFQLIYNSNHPTIKSIEYKVKEWLGNFGRKLNIVPYEALFFLDIEALFAQRKNPLNKLNLKTYEFYSTLSQLPYNFNWFLAEENHVKELRFNYYKWKFIKEYKGNLDSLTKYNDLNLLLSLLIQMKQLDNTGNNGVIIPSSISHLTHLEKLDLSENHIKVLPSSIENLKSLRNLDLSYNEFTSIPPQLLGLENLRYLDLSYNEIKAFPTDINKLCELNRLNLKGNKLSIKQIPRTLNSSVKINL
jgi:hypothetical protein